MANCDGETITALIVAVEETAGSALYGMIDVLASAGNLWQELVGIDAANRLFQPKIVSLSRKPFICGNNIPVQPEPQRSAVVSPRGGAVHPLKLARGLGRVAAAAGARLFEHAPVSKLEKQDGKWHLLAAGQRVDASETQLSFSATVSF